jgi:Protein of unknown function (DUF2637)
MKPADRITLKGRIGEAAAWAIAVIAWAISYGTQVALARDHGIHGWSDWEAIGMGALADLASLSMMMLALDQAERGKPARLTWVLAVLAALMMEWANIAYAGDDLVAIVLHAWPPFLAVTIVFVLVHYRRENAEPPGVVVIDSGQVEYPDRTAEPLAGQPNSRTEPLSSPNNRGEAVPPEPGDGPADRPDSTVTEAMFREAILELGPDASNKRLADRLGVHPDSIRRYRRRWPDAARPRVLSSGD